MDSSTAAPRYVMDATSLIHFERSHDLSRLPSPGVRLFIPDRVAREVNKPRTRLERWLKRNQRLVAGMLPEEGRLYLQFLRQPQIDDGEAAALAIASHREAEVVTDDIAAQRKADSHGLGYLGTGDFLHRALPRQLRWDELS